MAFEPKDLVVMLTRAPNGTAASGPSSTTDLAPAEWVLDVGFEFEGEFVPLDLKIPLDFDEPAIPRSRNEKYRKLCEARNLLYEEIHAIARTLGPGESRRLEGLTGQILKAPERDSG